MSAAHRLRAPARRLGVGTGLAAGSYLIFAGWNWLRYGRPRRAAAAAESDPLLDAFMPNYDVVERHHIRIAAPAAVTLAAAREMDLLRLPVARALFKAREVILGATADDRPRPRGLLDAVQSLGWAVLAEVPGREIVVGAVTRPWEANATFRTVPPRWFATFNEPGYVKIVWTLRADPIADNQSIFRTETRVTTTDPFARERFRQYWSFFSPGIWLIRRAMLGPLKAEAERRASASGRERSAA